MNWPTLKNGLADVEEPVGRRSRVNLPTLKSRWPTLKRWLGGARFETRSRQFLFPPSFLKSHFLKLKAFSYLNWLSTCSSASSGPYWTSGHYTKQNKVIITIKYPICIWTSPPAIVAKLSETTFAGAQLSKLILLYSLPPLLQLSSRFHWQPCNAPSYTSFTYFLLDLIIFSN